MPFPIKYQVGIKYCGHCNPQIHGPELVSKLQRLLPDMDVVTWDSSSFQILLIISACPVHCVNRPVYNGPWIEIVVNEIRDWQIPVDYYSELIIKACLELGLTEFKRVQQ